MILRFYIYQSKLIKQGSMKSITHFTSLTISPRSQAIESAQPDAIDYLLPSYASKVFSTHTV